MGTRAQQSFVRPHDGAIAVGASTPNAGATAGARAYSSVTGVEMRWNGATWAIPAVTPSGVRTATYTTASLGAGAVEQGSVTLEWGYRLLAVQTSAAARVRLYVTAAKRGSDAVRAVGTDPGYNAGCVMDVVTTDSATLHLTPEVVGHNRETSPTAAIPITVTATAAGVIVVTFTYLGTV